MFLISCKNISKSYSFFFYIDSTVSPITTISHLFLRYYHTVSKIDILFSLFKTKTCTGLQDSCLTHKNVLLIKKTI